MLDQYPIQPVRVGVVGLGSFGRLHALSLAGLAEAQLVALVARDPDQVQAMQQALVEQHAKGGKLGERGGPGEPGEPGEPGGLEVAGFTDLGLAIEKSDAQAWIVATSTDAHVDVTAQLLKAGKTVLLEKPIAQDLQEAQSLAPLVKDDSSNLMLGHILLFNSEFLALQEATGQQGPIHYIDCVRHRPITTLEMFPDQTPFHLLMVHDLYSVLALAKRAQPTGITAQVRRTAQGHIDLALAQLSWESGLVASLTASFMTPPGMSSDGFDRMEVFGDHWAARINANPRPITVWDQRAHWPMALEIRTDPTGPTGMMAQEQRCFCRVTQGKQSVPIGATYQDALQIQQWLDQMTACINDS